MPKFFIDEDMPRSTAKHLCKLGYDAKDVRDVGLRGAKDDVVFAYSQRTEAVLITGDLGFGNILHFPIGSHYGIVVAHFPNEVSTHEINSELEARLSEIEESSFQGSLIVVEPGKIRIRKK
jgi:predicted nuclease of predicted toxin-antitoxin system